MIGGISKMAFSSRTYQPGSDEPFKLSRSKIDLFLNCPRCFYLDRRLGIGRPQGPPFTLNSAVDHLLKKEFDIHRAQGTAHPLMEHYGIKAVPVAHEKLNEWRENFKGVRYLDPKTNLIITGAIDDLWQDTKKNFIVVDYKATSKDEAVTELAGKWHDGYKRQMEVYQWLLRKNGLKVSDMGYFVYCNGRKDRAAFDGKLEFEIVIISYEGNDKWVEKTIRAAHRCLESDDIPAPGAECVYCTYAASYNAALPREQKKLI